MSAPRELSDVWHRYEGVETASFVDLNTRIHVWRVDLDGLENETADNLSDDERARAARFHRPEDRRRSVATRSVLRRVLADLLDDGESCDGARLRFGYGTAGKPFLIDHPRLRFNVSHSEDLAVIAATRAGEVGIDVERQRPMDDMEKIARLIFDEAERTAMLGCPAAGREAVFFRIWTRKEALLKAMGTGFSTLNNPDAASQGHRGASWTVTSLPHLDGHAAALARPRGAHGLRLWSWPSATNTRSLERRARPRQMIAPARSPSPFEGRQ